MKNMNNKKFIESICDLQSKEKKEAIDQLHRLILDYGSETPDNLEAVNNITYIVNKYICGVGTQSGILASDILNSLEETSIPPEIKNKFPNLKKNEWEGILRYCTLVLCALEENKTI